MPRRGRSELQAPGFVRLWPLFGELEQRERDEVLGCSINKSCSVLVATDGGAWPDDCRDLSAVINVDVGCPTPEVHRPPYRPHGPWRRRRAGAESGVHGRAEMGSVGKDRAAAKAGLCSSSLEELTPAAGGELLPPI